MSRYIKAPEQKEGDRYPETNPEGTEIHNLNDKEFKTAIIKKLNDLQENTERQINKLKSFFTKEIETVKKNQSELLEMKTTMDEIKKNLDSLNKKADNMEERISQLEDRAIEMLHREEKRELRLKRNEEILQEISYPIRKYNMKIIGICKGEEKEN